MARFPTRLGLVAAAPLLAACGLVAGLDEFTDSTATGATGGSSAGGGGTSAGGGGGGGTGGGAQPGDVVWSLTFGDTGLDEPSALAVDGEGNSYVAGVFEGSIRLGSTDLNSAGAADIFLAKIDPSGAVVWSKRFGDGASERMYGVAVAPNGDLCVAGSFLGDLNLGGTEFTSSDGEDLFVARFDSDGAHLWSRACGGPGPQRARGVAIAANGDCALTGSFENQIDMGTQELTALGGSELLVATFAASTGATVHTRHAGAAGNQTGRAIAVGSTGAIYVTGLFAGSVDFGPPAGGVTSSAVVDTLVLRLNADLTPSWVVSFHAGAGTEEPDELTVHGDDELTVVGRFEDAMELEMGAPLQSKGTWDIFVGRLSPADGNATWSRGYGGPSHDRAEGAAVGPNGELVLGGLFWESMTIGTELTSSDAADAFAAMLDAQGTPLWARSFGGTGEQRVAATAVDDAGDPIIAGRFQNGIQLDGTGEVPSQGDFDVFVAKLAR